MGLIEILSLAAVVAWVCLRLWLLLWAVETLPSVLRECRASWVTSLSWVTFLTAVFFASAAHFSSRPRWVEVVWWTITVIAGLVATVYPDVQSWMTHRRRRETDEAQ
jgi:hypothetical protein